MSAIDEKKKAAACAALNYIQHDAIVGVGTGSTANYFIEQLATIKHKIEAAVASSEETATRLKALGIPVVELNNVGEIHVYVDGADEANRHLQLIKGGGGALTREKIVAHVATEFVCIIDDSKFVKQLGEFPLPVEVLPMARSYVAREFVKMGGDPEWREDVVTDNGNVIIDVFNLDMVDPVKLEATINHVPGVVCNGLFARRAADRLIIGEANGVRELTVE